MNALVYANEFIKLAKKENYKVLTPMKLQKLLYYFAGYFLVAKNSFPYDENFEAWQHGPVIPMVYCEFKKFGMYGIDEYSSYQYFIDNTTDEGNNCLKLLNRIWNIYKGYTALQLSEKTHTLGSPWCFAVADGTYILNREKMKVYFEDMISNDKIF